MTNACSPDEVSTRQYQDGDDEEIVALLKASFPSWEKRRQAVDYWRWRYLRSPLSTNIAISTVGGRIAGVGHCIQLKIKLGEKIVTSCYDDDYATYSKYRKMGVYKAVTNLTDSLKTRIGADFCYWITTNPIVLTKAMIHQQVTFPTPFSDLVRIRDINRFLELVPVENPQTLKAEFSNSSAPIRKSDAERKIELRDLDSFNEDFDIFFGKIANGYDYIMMRNHQYMNWRFTQNPETEYKIKVAELDGEIIGYAVLEVEDYNHYLIGSIFDLITFQDRMDLVYSIFEELVKYFDSAGIECISVTTMRGHPYNKAAISLGFLNATYASGSHVMFWGYNDQFYESLNRLRPDRIYFSYSDFY
jgi:hypothetical protein